MPDGDRLVDQVVGLGCLLGDGVDAKMLRLELLKVKANLERELGTASFNCSKCGLDIHWVSGLGVKPGHWGSPGARAARRAAGRDRAGDDVDRTGRASDLTLELEIGRQPDGTVYVRFRELHVM